MAKLIPLFSGSKGNSYFVGSGDRGILIDAGKNAKQIELGLTMADLSMDMVKGIFITHEHSDHTSALKVLTKKYNIPVFATKGTISALLCENKINDSTIMYQVPGDIDFEGFRVSTVKTSHDCIESCGYKILCPDGQRAMIATDTGVVTDEMRENFANCDAVVFESNHDVRMLKTGPYPQILKQRILSDKGHLSNFASSKELPDMVRYGTKHIVLAHISHENNSPSLAEGFALSSLEQSGYSCNCDYKLYLARQETGGEVIFF
ncbi:MAG: MBL fold metallo-hydrolase [Acutalibacteraceae bacterium]